MIILGVAFLADASACVLRDGEILSAVSEERLNRIKLWHGIPHRAIESALKIAGVSLDQIDYIATHGRSAAEPDRSAFEEKAEVIRSADLPTSVETRQLEALWSRYQHEKMVLGRRTPESLAQIAALGRPVKIYGHHQAHAACAYFGSGWDEATILTADGWGEDGSHTLSFASGVGIDVRSRSHTFDSLGYFYGSVTKALGFIPHRHEGKILGLAAHCPDPKSYAILRGMIDAELSSGRFVGRMERGVYVPRFQNDELGELVKDFPREDVAASAQQALEQVVCSQVLALGARAQRIALAGGVFANVKLNQRIAQLPSVESIYVFPSMGDGGLSVGSAWLAHAELTGERPQSWKTCYLGPAPSDSEIVGALDRSGLAYHRADDIHAVVADHLAAGKVVARCTGAMEFGPRALGHRSILYRADDPRVNRWLNDQLKRSEFMPFAPVSLADEADGLYLGLERCRTSAKFMTITCDCTPRMRNIGSAAVHVDGTARPQIVTKEENADTYAILQDYRARTGHGTVINTSFNMHEEPIVCTADDAVRAFVAGGLDVLAIGTFIVVRDERLLM